MVKERSKSAPSLAASHDLLHQGKNDSVHAVSPVARPRDDLENAPAGARRGLHERQQLLMPKVCWPLRRESDVGPPHPDDHAAAVVPEVHIDAAGSVVEPLVRFFRMRERRIR